MAWVKRAGLVGCTWRSGRGPVAAWARHRIGVEPGMDSGGAFIAASHSFMSHVLDAASAEAAALRDGLLAQ